MANITSTHQNQGGILSRQGSHKTNPGGRPNLQEPSNSQAPSVQASLVYATQGEKKTSSQLTLDTLKGDRVLKDYSSYKDKVYQQTDYFKRDRDIQVEINKVFQGFEKGETPLNLVYTPQGDHDDEHHLKEDNESLNLFKQICGQSGLTLSEDFQQFIELNINEDTLLKDFYPCLELAIQDNGYTKEVKAPKGTNGSPQASIGSRICAFLSCCPSLFSACSSTSKKPNLEPYDKSKISTQRNTELKNLVTEWLNESATSSGNGTTSPEGVHLQFNPQNHHEALFLIEEIFDQGQINAYIDKKSKAVKVGKDCSDLETKVRELGSKISANKKRLNEIELISGSEGAKLDSVEDLEFIFKEYVGLREALDENKQRAQYNDVLNQIFTDEIRPRLHHLLNLTSVTVDGNLNIDDAITNATGEQETTLQTMNRLNGFDAKTLVGVDGLVELTAETVPQPINEFTHTLDDPTYDRVIAALQGLDLNNEDLRDALVVLFNQFKAGGVAEYTGVTVFNSQTQETTPAVQPVPKFTFKQEKLEALQTEVGGLDLEKLKEIHGEIKGDGDQALPEAVTEEDAKAAVNAILAKDVDSKDALKALYKSYVEKRDNAEGKVGGASTLLPDADIEDKSTQGSHAVTKTTYSFKADFDFDFIKAKLTASVANATHTHALPAAATDLIAKLNEIEGIDVTDGFFTTQQTQQATTTFELTIPEALREKLLEINYSGVKSALFEMPQFKAVLFDVNGFNKLKNDVDVLFGVDTLASELVPVWEQQSHRVSLIYLQLNMLLSRHTFLIETPLYDSLLEISTDSDAQHDESKTPLKDELIKTYAESMFSFLNESKSELTGRDEAVKAKLEKELQQDEDEYNKLYLQYIAQLKPARTKRDEEMVKLDVEIQTLGQKLSTLPFSLRGTSDEIRSYVFTKLTDSIDQQKDTTVKDFLKDLIQTLFISNNTSRQFDPYDSDSLMGFFEIASLQNVVDSEKRDAYIKGFFKSDDDLQIRRDLGQAWLEFKPPQEELAESPENQDYGFYYLGDPGKKRLQFMRKNLAEGEKQVDFSFSQPSSTQPPSTQSPSTGDSKDGDE